MKLFTKITLMFFLISFIIVISTLSVNFIHTRKLVENEIIHKIEAISKSIANNIDINDANLNEYSNKLTKELGLAFIVIIDKNQTRLTHPKADLLGTVVQGGDSKEALEGKSYISIAKGSLKRSIRSFSPIYSNDEVVGAVIVGVYTDYLDALILSENKFNLYLCLGFLLLILLLSLLLNKNIKNILLGYEPKQIADILKRQEAILSALSEGVIAIDNQKAITLINQEAKNIFKLASLQEDLIGKNVDLVIPDSCMSKVLVSEQAQFNEVQKLNNISILTNRIPYFINGQIAGVVASFKKLKDVTKIANELIDTKKYADVLRANHHEFNNKLHTISALIECEKFQEVKSYIDKLITNCEKDLSGLSSKIKDKVILAFCESKFAFAKEFKIQISLDKHSYLHELNDINLQNDLVSVLSNLIDNAIDAVNNKEKKVIKLFIKNNKRYVMIKLFDSGCGIKDKMKILESGFSTKGANRGYGLTIISKIIAENEGNLYIASDESGSTFSAYLKILED